MVPAMKLMLVVSGCEPTKNLAAVLTAGSGAGGSMLHFEKHQGAGQAGSTNKGMTV